MLSVAKVGDFKGLVFGCLEFKWTRETILPRKHIFGKVARVVHLLARVGVHVRLRRDPGFRLRSI
jgi:hypothetical protein